MKIGKCRDEELSCVGGVSLLLIEIAATGQDIDVLFARNLTDPSQRRADSLPLARGDRSRRPSEGGIEVKIGEMEDLHATSFTNVCDKWLSRSCLTATAIRPSTY
jgi:hypothetical protein